MFEQARDYRDECAALDALLAPLEAADWEKPTRFKGWTANDVVGHLHVFDYAAGLTLESADSLKAFLARIFAATAAGRTHLDFTHEWLEGCRGPALRERWYAHACELAERYGAADPARRVSWAGPDMSVRSCITARQMETWSHSQALFDARGVERIEHDRLRNIAVIGINTFGWTFRNRSLPVPDRRPRVVLRAPSGAIWDWPATPEDPVRAAGTIAGDAVDFCRVVTQTRNVADTALRIDGEIARQWMALAQCFAGPAHDPPAPGTRFMER